MNLFDLRLNINISMLIDIPGDNQGVQNMTFFLLKTFKTD